MINDYLDWEVWLTAEKEETGIIYECVRCGAEVKSSDLEMRGGAIKCTLCGYRVLKKVRPPIVKRVRAR